jgi:hypothetical protein
MTAKKDQSECNKGSMVKSLSGLFTFTNEWKEKDKVLYAS